MMKVLNEETKEREPFEDHMPMEVGRYYQLCNAVDFENTGGRPGNIKQQVPDLVVMQMKWPDFEPTAYHLNDFLKAYIASRYFAEAEIIKSIEIKNHILHMTLYFETLDELMAIVNNQEKVIK